MPNNALDTTATCAGPARMWPTAAKDSFMIKLVPPVSLSTPANSMNMKMVRADSSVSAPSMPPNDGIDV